MPISQGVWDKQILGDNFASGNSIVVDDNGNSYISGSFDGFIKFEKSGIDDVIKSYNPLYLREKKLFTSCFSPKYDIAYLLRDSNVFTSCPSINY